MPTVKLVDRPCYWKISIPTSIAAKIDLELYDAVRGRTVYASRSRLITGLLEKWLESLKEGQKDA